MALARYQFTVTDEAGNVIPSASVEVRREDSGSPIALLYSDRAGATPIGNPITADADGFAAFHVIGGAYRITATAGGFSRVWRYVGIGLAAESDFLTTGATWRFDPATVDADPGAGLVRFNHGTLGSVTAVFLDNMAGPGADLTAWLDSLDNYGTSADRGILTIQTADQTGLLVARVTGSVVDGTGYRKVSVTPISTAGAFADGTVVSVSFSPAARDGITAGLPFNFDSSTSMADPGTGDFRLNNATLGSVTAAAVDDLSAASGNPDVSAAVLSWDDSTNPNRGYLLIKSAAAPQNFALYKISGASTDNSGWTQLALTYVTHAGSFTNGDACVPELTPSGDRGNLEVAIALVFGGKGTVIPTGIQGDLRVPFACTINSVTMLADQSGSIVVDIWKDTYANYPPVVGDSITASAKPTISAATKSEDTTLTGWTTAIAAGDTLRFNVDSASTITRVTLVLKVTKA